MAIKTSPYPQCKGGTFPDSAPRRLPSVARSGHINHAQTMPLNICLQNQPAMTGKAETLPDISAECRISTDYVFTRRDPQPRFLYRSFCHPSSLGSARYGCACSTAPHNNRDDIVCSAGWLYAPRVRHPVRIATDA